MSSAAFNLRRYGSSSSVDRHDVAQWVVPLQGELSFELEGQGSRLDVLQGIFVAPHAGHAQTATASDRFLIVDCPADMFDDHTLERLNALPTLALPAPVRAMARRLALLPGEAVDEAVVECELPVLMQAFSPAGTATRLQAVCARIAQAPGQDWPVARIAAAVGVSGSRLHALFQQAFELSPQAWLSGCRLRWSRAQLVESDASIAEIAQQAGYSEQSALTRALRREWGMTPAEYRRARVSVKKSPRHSP